MTAVSPIRLGCPYETRLAAETVTVTDSHAPAQRREDSSGFGWVDILICTSFMSLVTQIDSGIWKNKIQWLKVLLSLLDISEIDKE